MQTKLLPHERSSHLRATFLLAYFLFDCSPSSPVRKGEILDCLRCAARAAAGSSRASLFVFFSGKRWQILTSQSGLDESQDVEHSVDISIPEARLATTDGAAQGGSVSLRDDLVVGISIATRRSVHRLLTARAKLARAIFVLVYHRRALPKRFQKALHRTPGVTRSAGATAPVA